MLDILENNKGENDPYSTLDLLLAFTVNHWTTWGIGCLQPAQSKKSMYNFWRSPIFKSSLDILGDWLKDPCRLKSAYAQVPYIKWCKKNAYNQHSMFASFQPQVENTVFYLQLFYPWMWNLWVQSAACILKKLVYKRTFAF